MFCMQCGTKLPDTAQFCYSCGQKLAIPQQEAAIQSQASLRNVVIGDVELVEYIKEVQRAIINRVIEALESSDEALSQTVYEQNPALAADVLSLLDYEKKADNPVPPCTSQADVITRLATLSKKYPYLQPVYSQFARGQTQSAHSESMGQIANNIKQSSMNVSQGTNSDVVMEDIARRAAAEIGKNPVLRFRFLLGDLEETATKGDFSASTLKQAFDLSDELDAITDTRILQDREIKQLLPVLSDIIKGWVIWMTLKSRWEEDTKLRKPRVVVNDFQEIANSGLAALANRVGINKRDAERFGIDADNPGRLLIDLFTPYPRLTAWLQIYILKELFYFLLQQGYAIGKSPQLAGAKKIFGAEFVDSVLRLAQQDYAENRGKK